jgi:hypothetical protein
MPVAICNTCNEIITWRAQRNSYLKDQRCACGSKDLTAISSRFNDEMTKLFYYDRSGKLRKIVDYIPRLTLLS